MNTLKQEHVRRWTDPDGQGFAVDLWDTYLTDGPGRYVVWFEMSHGGEVIFDGRLGCSPLHSIDSDEVVATVLTFCSLRPGDTDREYFEDYTPRQLEWCQEWGETLSLYTGQCE